MIRTVNILLIGGMMAGAGVVYHLKYEAERATTRIAQLTRGIQQEREHIAMLRAEWSLANQPRRLQAMVEHYQTYLELEPLDPNQVGTIDDIPLRTAPSPAAPKPGAPIVASGKSLDHTGSIRKPSDRPKTDKPAALKTFDPRPNDPLTNIIR